mgnify:CR=1 FL=1
MKDRNIVIESVDDTMAEILSKKNSTERLKMGFDLWESARQMIYAQIKGSNPYWNNETINREVAKRISHGTV